MLVGSSLGVLLGARLPERVRTTVTVALGLTTLLIAGLSAAVVSDPALREAVGSGAVLVVLGALVIGGAVGSALRLDERLRGLGDVLRRRVGSDDSRFTDGFVTASLVFCVGPLTVLGALLDGLGRTVEPLVLKSTLDGFASLAFAAALGWGVAASALTVLVLQGSLTLVGVVLGDVLGDAEVAGLEATGGLLLVGVALRLLDVAEPPVADLLPALAVAPLLVAVAAAV